MEQRALHQTLGFAEWQLGTTLGELMDEHRAVVSFRHNCRKVVTLGVPSHLPHRLEVSQNEADAIVPLSLIRLIPSQH